MSDETDDPAQPDSAGRELLPTHSPSPPPPPPAADPNAGKDAASEEDEVGLDEAWVDEDDKAKVLGSQYERQKFGRNRASGPSMWGNNNTQNVFATDMATNFRRPPDIDELADFYVSTDEKEEKALREALDRRTTVCLSGEPETGRFSTACLALLERFGPGGVEEIIPPPARLPADAIHQLTSEDLQPDTGYVLRIDGSDPGPFISRLDALVHARHARLVLIRNVPARAVLRGGEIRHVPPQPAAVFQAHVQRVGRQTGRAVDDFLRLADTLRLPRKPRDVVWLADEALRHTAAEAERVLGELDSWKLRGRARDILGAQVESGVPARRRLPQHRRAFRLAYAAMAGQPVGEVFDATGRLLSKLDAESGWDDLGRTALEHSVTALLGEDLASAWQSPDNLARVADVEDDLVRAIFDVAWHDFDHTRPALLAWLNDMVEDPDDAAREAAIRAAVVLALLDFDGIWRALIDPWSRSPKTRVRLSAARVVLFLGSANRVNHVVARRVHEWVKGKSNLQRDTAAWAYAGGMLLIDPRWILADLRRIADDPKQQAGWTVATAVSRLLEPRLRGLIVATLAGWVREDSPARIVTRHAARSFTRMMLVMDEDRRGPRPVLLLGLAAGDVRVRDLSELWYPALLGSSTWLEAWNGLLVWLRHGDTDRDLRGPLTEMLRDMAVAAALRRRLRRCLSRPDTPYWITAVVEEWTR